MSPNYNTFKVDETLVSSNEGVQLVYGDLSQYCPEFKVGVGLFDIKANAKALHYFQLAYESVTPSDIYHNKYASYCGLVRVVNGDRGGLELCRDAARSEIHDGDVFLNLARAEWHYRNRKNTINALLKGLEVDERHPGLNQMCDDICMRKRTVIPMLGRNHPINQMVGKLFRKK